MYKAVSRFMNRWQGGTHPIPAGLDLARQTLNKREWQKRRKAKRDSILADMAWLAKQCPYPCDYIDRPSWRRAKRAWVERYDRLRLLLKGL